MSHEERTRQIGVIVSRHGKLRVRDLFRRRNADLADEGGVRVDAVVEVDVWRDDGGRRRAAVVRELAGPGSARGKLYRALAEQGLSPSHPPDVEAEAKIWAEDPLDVEGLEDLTALPFVTIDNEDSKDLDQALYVERSQEGGGYVVWYALADAAHFVRPGSALFREALKRGASFYLPGVTVPMLPRALSEGIISLNAGVLRRALTMRMSLDSEGHRRGTTVHRSVIRSRAKLTYDGVQQFHDTPESSAINHQQYTESLELLGEVGQLRIALARERDVVNYNRAEVEIGFETERGEVFTVRASLRNDVEKWNEQVSLLCNTEGARLLAEAHDEAHVQAVYRVHPTPSPEAIASLRRSIDAVVAAHGLDPAHWSWKTRRARSEPYESLADYLTSLEMKCQDKSSRRLLAAIERLAMRTSEAASYSIEPGPHYGVGAEGYARISAPMREVVGIFTHKELFERLGDPEQACDDEADEALRLDVVEAGNRSRKIQRQLTKEANRRVIDQLFERDLTVDIEKRPWRVGTIISVRPTRLYVELDEPPIEVKVYCRLLDASLVHDLSLDDAEVALRDTAGEGGFVLGGELHLRVKDADEATGRWIFDLRRR